MQVSGIMYSRLTIDGTHEQHMLVDGGIVIIVIIH
jgi:hypothetical protein